MSSSLPSGDAALQALAVVLAPLVARHLTGAASRPYSQRDGERPPGAGRMKFLRTWRRARDAGDEGAWSEGRARLMTADAWARWTRTTREKPTIEASPATAPTLLDELGAKRVAE